MDWKKIIGTILPTVGTIAGKFLGVGEANGEDCAIVYKFASNPSANDGSGCEASFVKRNGKICLFNKSDNENSVVALSSSHFTRICRGELRKRQGRISRLHL